MPGLAQAPGTYDQAYLQFFFSNKPELQMNVQIVSQVEDCEVESV